MTMDLTIHSKYFDSILNGNFSLPKAAKMVFQDGEKLALEIRSLEKFEKYSRIEGLVEIEGEPRFFSANIVNGSETSLLKIK